ncbi:PINc/VapC family ATPase, partial [Candidatus Woesearchaeota archaeon]|nr:PINc/VapC family ATPase [Candidatus Woesearchaeota archaeon]
RIAGARPRASEIKYADLGEIDNLIRQLAFDEDATLITSDKVQARVAEAKGIVVEYVAVALKKLKLDKYFDKTTMSVHLMEDVVPYAKKGMTGKWQFAKLSTKKLSQDAIREISKEIIENARIRHDGFIEIERTGSLIIQLGMYRIVICKPPFSDGWEITAVRPIKQLNIDDYKLSEKLRTRIEKAEGILIAGAPGMGKSTFAQALAVYYSAKDKIVKTVEAPRDLQLGPSIMQYALSHGSLEEIHDILLLSRPDYTIYDEMRNTPDFNLFADLRLSGVGMIGVVHATQPIDAVQRFVGRIELGVIPHIIDTVIFIRNGTIDSVLSVEMTVKVPSGMTEADLARPVVVVADFETGKPAFELYSYGEETVVIPVQKGKAKNSMHELAAKSIETYFRKFSKDVNVEMTSDNRAIVYVPENVISRVIGKKGENISGIEKELGVRIDIRELTKSKPVLRSAPFEVEYTNRDIIFYLEKKMRNKDIKIYAGNELLLSAKAGKKAVLRIKRKSDVGMALEDALHAGKIRLG